MYLKCYKRRGTYTKPDSEKVKGRNHLRDLVIDGRIILECMIEDLWCLVQECADL
jgi:hypothetical protein